MDNRLAANRTCPACGSAAYPFRGRKKITPEPGQEGEQAVETKYRCKGCGQEWRVRTPAKGASDAS
jgi:hypothetical protein